MQKKDLDNNTQILTNLWDMGFNTFGKMKIILEILIELEENSISINELSDVEKMKFKNALHKLININIGETILPRPPFEISNRLVD